MNGSPSSNGILRRSRIAGWATGIAAALASLGLIVGVSHSASSAATTTTGSTNTSSNNSDSSTSSGSTDDSESSDDSTNSGSGLGSVDQNQPAQGGSNGS